MSDLVRSAFAALGEAPSCHELERVADALVRWGDQEAVDCLEAAAADRGAFDALVEDATEAGSSGFTALDLVTQVTTGERPVMVRPRQDLAL